MDHVAKLAELRARAESLVMKLNEGVQEGIPNPTMKITVDGKEKTAYIADELKQVINEHTAKAREICFNECREADDPMLEAVKRLRFKTITVKSTAQGEEKIPVSRIDDTTKEIDLFRLHKAIDGGIGKDPKWNAMVENMNFHMTARQAKRIIKNRGNLDKFLKEINGSYLMSQIARDIDLGKDPTSNTKLLATLQAIVTAMIGEEYKATSHDVNYMTDIYAKKDSKRALSVVCSNHSQFRSIVANVCHAVVTGEDYMVFAKTKTQN